MSEEMKETEIQETEAEIQEAETEETTLEDVEIEESDLEEVAGGTAVNGKYYRTIPAGWVKYRIKYGDCLSVLAAKRHTTVSMIMRKNPLIDNANVIRAGYWMVLPR